MSTKDNPRPFESEWEPPKEPKKTLKIANKKSVNKTAEAKQVFEQAAEEFMAEKTDRKQKAIELSKQFMATVNDQTLAVNKGPLQQDVERELVSKLVSLGLVVNQDDSEPEGYGSIAMINLLFKAVLSLRDRLNQESYKNSQLENKLSSLMADRHQNDK